MAGRVTDILYINMEKEKTKPCEHTSIKPNLVEEPVALYGSLALDKSKRYTYADYLTWMDDKRRELINGFIHLMSGPLRRHGRISWNYKFNLYEAAGVREYWIVDPKAQMVNVFLLQSDGKYDLGTTYDCNQKAPVSIFKGLEIDLNEIFED